MKPSASSSREITQGTTPADERSSAGAAARPRTERPARKEWRIKKLARLAFYCGCVTVIGAGLAVRSAYGDVKQSALELGHELGKLDDVGSERPIVLNGQPIFVKSTVEDVPVEDVLDLMEAHCERNSTGVRREIEDLARMAKTPMPKDMNGRPAAGIMREESSGRGMVACLARDEDDGRTGWQSLEKFVDSGDLSEVGNIRYVYAEETKSGRTHIIAVWTDGPFNLRKMFPEHGDAPGTDIANVPRPGGGRRILSAAVEGAPYGVRLYEAAESPEGVLAPYDKEMAAQGWQTTFVDAENHHRAYSRGKVDIYVTATPRGDGATVSMIEMPVD